MADYVVDVLVPIAIRIENVEDEEQASEMAIEAVYAPTGFVGDEPRGPSMWEQIQSLVENDVDTAFVSSDSAVQTEVGEA